VLQPYDLAWLAVVAKIEAVLDISCCCHKNINVYSLYSNKWGLPEKSAAKL
jgi:hypothetical protein